MYSYELILIVAASVGLGVAVSMVLLSIPAYDEIQSFIESFGLALGAAGIAIGIIIAYFQNKQSNRMDRIIFDTHGRENKIKRHFLHRIRSSTETIQRNLSSTLQFIETYNAEGTEQRWTNLRNHVTRVSAQTQEMGNWVNQDFAIIILLVENAYLADKFWPNYVLPSTMLYGEILHITYPQFEANSITEIMNCIRQEILMLDEALSLIDKEMPKIEANKEERREWKDRLTRFSGSSPS